MKKANFLYCLFAGCVLLFAACDKDEISDAQAESFLKYFGSSGEDMASRLVQMADGGFAVVGTLQTLDKGDDIYLIRTDKFGNKKWEAQTWGDAFDDVGYDIELDSDGNLLVIGSIADTISTGDIERDVLLIKVNDSDGSTMWTRNIGDENDEEAYDLLLTEDGDYILGGYIIRNNDKDHWIVKIQGDSIRDKTFGSIDRNEEIVSLAMMNNGNYVGIGNSVTGSELNVVPLLFGVELSYGIADPYKRTGDDIAGNILQTDNGYFTVSSSRNAGNNNSIILISTISFNDNYPMVTPLNEIEIPGTNLYGSYICKLNSVGYAIIGTTETAGNEDIYLVVTDSQWNMVTSNTFGSAGSQKGVQVEQTPDGGFIILGTNTFDQNCLITLIKVKPDGTL